jgi:hypothetical protein
VNDSQKLPVTLGFLTVVQEPSGWVGGYLVTNSWGRPLEFRLTTAVQPNRVQTVLYGPTLTEYLHADLIGKTLVEKTSVKPDLIVTDSATMLGLRARLEIHTVTVHTSTEAVPDAIIFTHGRSSAPLLFGKRFEGDRPAIEAILERIDPAVDLAEPFARIREAVVEARKMGVTSRAA